MLFDTWVHPLVMGLEEHLLTMFRDDFEFSDSAGASHLGHGSAPAPATDRHAGLVPASTEQHAPAAEAEAEAWATEQVRGDVALVVEATGWSADAERELLKIPFFVRGKARRNTERYAAEQGIAAITLDTLYDAKAHYAR